MAETICEEIESQVKVETTPRTILLVEDSEPLRNLLCELLESLGHTVLEAPNADGAKEIAERHGSGISLLLTDLSLPGTSGIALAKSLISKHPQWKVLFMSGHPGATVAGAVSESGGDFLQKPFTHEALAEKLHSLFDSRPS